MAMLTNPLIRVLIIMLLVLFLLLLLFIVGEMIRSGRRASRKRTQTIKAIITDTHFEAGNMAGNWVITAQWLSPSLPKPYVFVSPPLSLRPTYRIGDPILIDFNPNNPRDYRMQLDD